MSDDYDIAVNLVDNVLTNVKVLREHYSLCLDAHSFENLLEDEDFQWFLDELDEYGV